jgi:hypothetical protein
MIAPQLHYLLAHERTAELHRAAQLARLATQSATERGASHDCHPITRLGARLARLAVRFAPSWP